MFKEKFIAFDKQLDKMSDNISSMSASMKKKMQEFSKTMDDFSKKFIQNEMHESHNISRVGDNLIVTIPMEDFSSDNVDVNVSSGVLSISMKNEDKTKTKSFSMTLSENVDQTNVKAKVKGDILIVTAPIMSGEAE